MTVKSKRGKRRRKKKGIKETKMDAKEEEIRGKMSDPFPPSRSLFYESRRGAEWIASYMKRTEEEVKDAGGSRVAVFVCNNDFDNVCHQRKGGSVKERVSLGHKSLSEVGASSFCGSSSSNYYSPGIQSRRRFVYACTLCEEYNANGQRQGKSSE